jgi:hypothetical protein
MRNVITIVIVMFIYKTSAAQALKAETMYPKLECVNTACFMKSIGSINAYTKFDSTETMLKYTDYGHDYTFRFEFYKDANVSEVQLSSFTKSDYDGWKQFITSKGYKLVDQKIGEVVEFIYLSDTYPNDVMILKEAKMSQDVRYGITMGRKHTK